MANSELKKWLFRRPQPTQIRAVVDDTEKTIEVNASKRGGWAELEQTIVALGASSAEALDRDGNVLRAITFSHEAAEADSDSADEGKFVRGDLAQILHHFGQQISLAYQAGAAAASENSQQQMRVVSTLVDHLTVSIQNLHKMSVQLSLVQAQAGQDGADETMRQMMAMLNNAKQLHGGGG